MKTLIIINGGPYGTEKAYNALRIANQLGRDYKDELAVRFFLMADAATCAVAGQENPEGYYDIGLMMKLSVAKGAKIRICSCAAARGIKDAAFVRGAELSTMKELAEWIATSDKVLTFYNQSYGFSRNL
ncbi:MAG: DsrE family protein [Balneolaceae bacterium]